MIKLPDVTLLYVIVAFVVSYALLRKFLFGPLSAIVEERERLEKSAAEVHARSLEEMQRAIAEGEARLAAARREALKARESLRGEGRAHLERELAGAREEATSSITGASREIKEQADRSAAELPGRARELARLLAEKVLGRKLAA
jgi:F-type H+-transporting ATPase subunit b